jgi:hypothetical protein
VAGPGVTAFLEDVGRWAAGAPGVQAVALVGSYAAGRARPDSDVDLVVLLDDPRRLLGERAWLEEFGVVAATAVEDWGAVTSLRVHYAGGLEVEWGLAGVSWAGVGPVDPGTARVVRDGLVPLHDPGGLLARLEAAVRRGAP